MLTGRCCRCVCLRVSVCWLRFGRQRDEALRLSLVASQPQRSRCSSNPTAAVETLRHSATLSRTLEQSWSWHLPSSAALSLCRCRHRRQSDRQRKLTMSHQPPAAVSQRQRLRPSGRIHHAVVAGRILLQAFEQGQHGGRSPSVRSLHAPVASAASSRISRGHCGRLSPDQTQRRLPPPHS